MLSPPQRPIPKSTQLNEFPEKIFYLLLVRFILLVSKTRQEEEVHRQRDRSSITKQNSKGCKEKCLLSIPT